jgi:hypothetical protein
MQLNTHWPADKIPGQTSKGARTGAAIAASGGVALALWTSYVNWFVLGFRSERVYEHCLSAVGGGNLTKTSVSTFPTQWFCETADDRYAAGYYPFWVSVGYSSVFVILGLVALYGMWMIVRRDKNTQRTP